MKAQIKKEGPEVKRNRFEKSIKAKNLRKILLPSKFNYFPKREVKNFLYVMKRKLENFGDTKGNQEKTRQKQSLAKVVEEARIREDLRSMDRITKTKAKLKDMST